MVTGLFNKSEIYTTYQERSRIIAVTEKNQDFYIQNKKQLIFCVSDLFIKVWTMEFKSGQTNLVVFLLEKPCIIVCGKNSMF